MAPQPLITTLADEIDAARGYAHDIALAELAGGAHRVRAAGQAGGAASRASASPFARLLTRIGIRSAS